MSTHPPHDIARQLGVGVERIRQLRQRAESSARELAAAQPELDRTVGQLGERLGAAAPVTVVDATLASMGLPPSGDGRSALVLWLAGPYRRSNEVPGWMTRGPHELGARTAGLLRQDGGVHHNALLRKELTRLGIHETHVDAWLGAQPVRVHGEETVYLAGSAATVAERILHCTATAMSPPACRSWAGDRATPVDVWQQAMQRDRRFVHVGGNRFELAEWGSEAVEVRRPDPTDRPAARRAPAALPTDHAAVTKDPPGPTVAVVVDRDVLAGKGGAVPFSLMVRLGIKVGARRSLSTRYGPLLLSHAPDGPHHGTLRPIAVASGAAPGDVLVLSFEEGSTSVDVALQRTPTRPRPAQ